MSQNPSKVHSSSKSLQRADMTLGSCVALYNGIESFCQHLRDEYVTTEKDGLKLTTGMQKTYVSPNKRNRKTKKILIMKERTLDTIELWKMLDNPLYWNLLSNH